jgi:pyruvate formate lyase activating enzyme
MPAEAVKMASRSECATIAYTYTEPSIFFEYMLDTAARARAKGIRNIYHSNGSLNPQPLNELTKYLDGANIDLKAFDQDFYSRVCEGYLETVLMTLKILKQKGVWVEITTLVVPTMNDDLDHIKQMSLWIKDNLGDETPLHFSRFWPQYRLASLLPTPVSTLDAARETAMKAGLKYVYVGNVPGHKAESTYCPKCGKAVIKRSGYSVLEYNLDNKNCKFCGYPIAGVWS